MSFSYNAIPIIPIRIQVALFKNVFKYNIELSKKEVINILLVYNDKTNYRINEYVNAFSKLENVILDTINEDILSERINLYDVVYVLPDMNHISKVCKSKGVLTISCVPSYAESGEVAIAVGLQNDKPRVFINLKSLEDEGHHVSAKLLQVAEIFK